MKHLTRHHDKKVEPRDVVVAAYTAANLGRYSTAGRNVSSTFKREIARSQASTRAQAVALKARLRRKIGMLKGRRDQSAVAKRKSLLKLLRVAALLLRVPSLVSDRANKEFWKAATHNNSIASIRVTRQIIRGSTAIVHFWLTFRNGTVVKDQETLVRSRDRWFLG